MKKSTNILSKIVGKRVNFGAGYSLEIPLCFIFQGQVKEMTWVKKKIEEAEKMIQFQIKKMHEKCTLE